MSLLFCDSFSHYATAHLPSKGWVLTGSPTIAATGGRRGAGSFRTSNMSQLGKYTLPTNYATLICGFAMKLESVTSRRFFYFLDAGTTQIMLNAQSDNTIGVFRGTGTLLGTSGPTQLLVADTWIYIEIKVVFHPVAGSVIVRGNGVEWINLSGINTAATGNAFANAVALGGNTASSGIQFDFCDLVVMDNAGSENNDLIGDIRVDALLPTAAGATTQWTPLASTNVSNVDEATPDSDTTYVSSANPGDIDTYVLGDVSASAVTIKGVQVNAFARKDDAGSRTLAPVIRTGAANFVGASQSVLDQYSFLRTIWETNPNTGVAWTVAEINALEAGQKMVA